MPSSFPLVGMGIAVLIGICVMGFLLSPGPSQEEPTVPPPYSATPEENGSDTDRVLPESKPPTTDPVECDGVTLPLIEVCL